MSVKSLLIVVIIGLSGVCASAQNMSDTSYTLLEGHDYGHHDIGISAGHASAEGFFIMGFIKGIAEGIAGSIKKKPHDFGWVGVYGAHYYYRLKPWCQLGAKVVYEGVQTKVYADSSKTAVDYRYYTSSLSFMPSVRFIYVNRSIVKLYSGVDVGICYMWDSDISAENRFRQVFFAFDIIPIGLIVGKKWYGMVETNFGADAYLKIGVGYRFD